MMKRDASSHEVTVFEHTASTIALCFCSLTHCYLLISVFPYSGYMAMDLIPSTNEENAGSYAGLISSVFMVGRSLTSYGWGKAADVYGRTFVLYASLWLSCIFGILFGLSTSFSMALFWRFLQGLGNGIMGTAKTASSELANGNMQLETRGMGMFLGMWGWGFLIAPVISGATSEPVRQYPGIDWLQEGALCDFLSAYPFFLPNLIGALLCLVTIAAVRLFVTETLPSDILRPAKAIPADFVAYLGNICLGFAPTTVEETTPIRTGSPHQARRKSYISISQKSNGVISSRSIMDQMTEDIEDAIRESKKSNDESTMALLSTTRTNSDSIARKIARRSSSLVYERRMSQLSEVTKQEPATIASLLAQKNVRNHMVVYWMMSFMMVAVDQGFPLFCMSKDGGLGLSENSIGRILSAAGLMFAITQYIVYALMLEWFGLYGTIRWSAVLSGPTIVLIPISLYLNQGMPYDMMTWTTFVFLAAVNAIYRIFSLAFFSSITVATNRTVTPAERGTMNGLITLGGSIVKGLGPAFAGVLVAFSLSSGVFSPHEGAIFVFLVIGLLGVVATVMAYFMLQDPDEEESATEMKCFNLCHPP